MNILKPKPTNQFKSLDKTKHKHDTRSVVDSEVPQNSRGRYLLIVAEDTDLMSWPTKMPAPNLSDMGEPTTGGADVQQILKKFSTNFFNGGNSNFMRSNTLESYDFWPYITKTHEPFEGGRPQGMVWPSGAGPGNNNYAEPLKSAHFLQYLKSRGFIVDIAILNRRIKPDGGELLYYGAHPDDVPDYSEVIPWVTEDWSKFQYTHWDNDDMWYNNPSDNTAPCGPWKPFNLWVFIRMFHNKYKDTNHPLKYVTLFGNAGAMPRGVAYQTRASELIPGFDITSYSFTMKDLIDWPYHWSEKNMIQPGTEYGGDYAPDSILQNWTTYEDAEAICLQYGGDGMESVENNSFDSRQTDLLRYDGENDDLNQFFDRKSLHEPDYAVSRINTKTRDFQQRNVDLQFQITNTISYHNFQSIYLSNSPFCVADNVEVDGYGNPTAYGKCHQITRAGTGEIENFQTCPPTPGIEGIDDISPESIPEGYNCAITGEDAIMAGCLDGSCVWFSRNCSTWEEMEHFKEYYGNSIHIGVDYAG